MQVQPVEALQKLGRRLLDQLVELKLDDAAVELWRRLYRQSRQLDVRWLWHLLHSGSDQGKQRAAKTLYNLLRGQERAEAAGEALTALLTWINQSPESSNPVCIRLTLVLHTWLFDLITEQQPAHDSEREARAPSALAWLMSVEDSQATLQALAAALVHPCHLAVSASRWPMWIAAMVSFWLISEELRALLARHGGSEELDRGLAAEWLQAAFSPVPPLGSASGGEPLPHLFQTLLACVLYVRMTRECNAATAPGPRTALAERTVETIAQATERASPRAILRMISYVAQMQRSVLHLLGTLNQSPVVPAQQSVRRAERARLQGLHTDLKAVQQILRATRQPAAAPPDPSPSTS